MVDAAGDGGRRPRELHRLLDVGGAPERSLLCRAVSVAVLFAVYLEVVPALDVRLRAARFHVPGDRRPVAGVPDPVGPRSVPPDVLLLPEGVLPLVLAGAAGVRRAGREGDR